MLDKVKSFFNNKTVLILGFGLEGKSTYNLLKTIKTVRKIAIADKNFLKESVDCDVYSGDNYLDSINDYDIVMKSPGIALFDSLNEYDRKKITSQTDLFLRLAECKSIGITGTKGKSTTSSLIYHILKNCDKKTTLIGNIGVPPLDNIAQYDKEMIAVCEMSCHQLEYVKASPDIAVLLNIYEEHLDHYCDFNAYKKSKENIYRFLNKENKLIYNISVFNNEIEALDCKKNSASMDFENADIYANDNYIRIKGIEISMKNQTKLIGRHNLYNIAVAISVCLSMGCDLNEILAAIATFKGLPHRLESLGVMEGVEYINDSISTIPEATINALKALPDSDVLIVGGMDRRISYSILIDFLEGSNIENLIVLPYAGERIKKEILERFVPKFKIYSANNLKDAVDYAKKHGKKRCILSPAAASYDVYRNFEERGEDFRRLVLETIKQ